MSISYSICKVIKFSKQKHVAHSQLTLEGTEDLPESYYDISDPEFLTSHFDSDGPCETNNVRKAQYKVAKYIAYQDVKQNKYGRVFGKYFNWYLEPFKFSMYYVKELKIMIFATGKKTVDAFLKQMEDDPYSDFKCEKITVDFSNIKPLLPIINGAWVAQLNKQYLKSAGLFGQHVDKSEEFQQAANLGIISSLMFPYPYLGKDLQIAITKNGAIVFYSRIKNPTTKEPDIAAELKVIIDLYLKYISHTSN